MNENELTIRPITFRWQEWVRRHDELEAMTAAATPRTLASTLDTDAAQAFVTKISDWMREQADWLKTLSVEEREDVTALLDAEADMLWQVAYPAAHAPSGYFPPPPGEDERLDFRTRYYRARPLLLMAQQAGFPRADAVTSAYNDLEAWVTEKRGWLP